MIKFFRQICQPLLLMLLFTGQIKAQKSISLIDFFYQSLSLTERDTISPEGEIGAFRLDDYSGEVISPQTIINKFPDAAQYLVDDSIFIIRPVFIATGLMKDLAPHGDSKLTIKNFHFTSHAEVSIKLYSDIGDEVFNSSKLTIEQCTFDDQLFIWFCNFVVQIKNCVLDDLWIGNESVVCPKIRIENNKINLLQFWAINSRDINVANNEIGFLHSYEVSCNNLWIRNNTFKDPGRRGSNWTPVFGYSNLNTLHDLNGLGQKAIFAISRNTFENNQVVIRGKDRSINGLFVYGNQFIDSTHTYRTVLAQRSTQMEVRDNHFETQLLLSSSVSQRFVLEQNHFEHVSMGAAMPSTPQNYVSVDWLDLKGKLFHQENSDDLSYFGIGDEDLADQHRFFGLLGGYSRLLDVYKSYGNLDDANDVFLEMKALHMKRHSYMYRTYGGTTNFFKLNLGRLLSVYTRHGTDPAQAMTASLWIIIFFSVIYFFFPSDWDLHSKSKLISNFKELVEKNEKGVFRPLLSLLKGLIYSFFNAITLSVNSFVTLGFGMIPTRGLAKYICIFQGFLGWFLLSIFIVALINQILI